MVRRSTRSRRPTSHFGYNASFQPYSRSNRKKTVRLEGRRHVPEDPIVYPELEKKDTQLKVQSLDLCLELNKVKHQTKNFKEEDLVLRRGQPFLLNIEFNRDYKPGHDEISLELRMGTRAVVSKGTRCVAPLVKSAPDHNDWGIQVLKSKGPKVELKVFSSSEALIGYYNLFICTTASGDEDEFEYPEEVIMLFNAWCKDDDVYMEDEDKRQEYVLNETGMYFYGSENQIGSSPWNYGQFEKVSLDCALYLLQKSGLLDSNRKSAVHVARSMSALVNSQDDDGVLEGRWDGEYADGIAPTVWTGSIAILSQYMKKREPVAYGQCWVFGSLLTGLLRSLGLPTRTITNFGSAHDTDGNLTLDYHYDEKLNPLDDYDEDSIWNFHVWNDCWMARPDLDEGYGGWQAVDATPQETSHGVYCLGPASLTAIKQGHVQLNYDTKFAFAEVNAEKVYWKVFKSRKPPAVIDVESSQVGFHISTKAVGKYEREDITDQYKYKEGSELERIAVREASTHVRKAKKILKNIVKDVQFSVDMPENPLLGKDIKFFVSVKNTSDKVRDVYLAMNGNSVYYTGVKKGKIVSHSTDLELKPKQSKSVPVTVLAKDYLPALTDYAGISFFIMGSVKQTRQPFSKQLDTVLEKPDLVLEINQSIKQGKPFSVLVSLTNPLPYPLTGCKFLIEGHSIAGVKQLKAPTVAKNGEMHHEVHLTAKNFGSSELIISFISAELTGVKGHATLHVSK
ncbi:protein-glutamine gamma-glutamyltransferase K-like [Asterias amurensis]|uniref:protein-glutamine gamma-glutamyltransferase K-like n=1 Tax=Asterias amurensis TaxID=7602 RepID=UPI003AB323E4